jgi:predicted Zn-dependent protease
MDGQMIALCREALDYATHNGVEKAECYLQLSKVTEVDIIGGVLSQMNSIYREEVLVRIIKDQRSVSSLISSFNFDCIAKAVDECIGAVEYVEPDAYEDISDGPLKYFYTDRDSAIDPKSLVLLAQHYLDEVHRHYPNIEISELRLPAVEVFSVFGNTNDVLLTHAYTKYDCFVEYMSCAETQQCSYYYDFSFSSLPLHLLDLFDQRFWYECIGRISDIRQPAFIKKCQILLAPSVVEDILIDGVYTLTNSVAIMSDASIWRDRMHSCVADKRLSIALDPYNENIVSGERITDNGTISQPFFLIRNGILENFYLTRKASLISGFPMAPNTSDKRVPRQCDATHWTDFWRKNACREHCFLPVFFAN